MHEEIISKIVNHEGATDEEYLAAANSLAAGELSADQAASIRGAVLTDDASVEDLAALCRALRSSSDKIEPKIDGDIMGVSCSGNGAASFNNSVAAAIVASAGGAVIAKNVMPSQAGFIGSLEVLKALGINTNITGAQAASLLEEIGIAFYETHKLCPASEKLMEGANETELKIFWSIVEPMINPASPKRYFYGDCDAAIMSKASSVATSLGVMNGIFASGDGGVDEISLSGPTHVNEIASGRVVSWDTKPEDNALECCSIDEIKMSSPKEAAFAIRSVLSGKLKGPRREVIVLNAGAALMASGKAGYFMRALLDVRNAIDDGRAAKKLEELKKKSAAFK